ncbi:MAG: glucose-6-phosphate dehydrogenase [Bacteroidales bacterium]|nr:glucose-6-phosphate dehydrogenase [Bacteroidales bacterium]MCB9013868.1 glucose-6-phosphate dehydrogenase [Bacteroidales bacterium]
MQATTPHLIVIFGASGDLTRRKLIPALFNLKRQALLPDNFAVLGVGRTPMDDESFRDDMKAAIASFSNISKAGDKAIIESFISLLHYASIDTFDADSYSILKDKIVDLDKKFKLEDNIIFYLATPPILYDKIPVFLAKQKLNRESHKLIIEKPFGINLESARNLNKDLLKYYSEDQIYRIDHYLGKETVQNILVTRFSNQIFEPLWNRNYIHHVEITSAESIGVEKRGGYYDNSGALRDMVQNHLLQLVGLVAMEPPILADSTNIRNETLKVFKALRHISMDKIRRDVIRGQYLDATINRTKVSAYRNEEGVRPDSKTETFAAMKFYIDNWRWSGVPFYIRTGKRLPIRVSEVVIHFKETPHHLFCNDSGEPNASNQLVIRIQPDEGLLMKFGMKVPGAGFTVQNVNMDFHYSSLSEKEIPEAYERLLLDCMLNDSTLYARGDAVETTWEFINPILELWKNEPEIPLYGYPSGTWGPDVADSLIEEPWLTWRYPCKNLSNDGIYCEL